MLVCAAHGIEAEPRRASLAARLAHALANPSPTHQVLERLYLDLLQKHASARMRVELASEQLGRGLSLSASDVLKLAFASLAGYRREAANHRCKLVLHVLKPVTVQADPGALRLIQAQREVRLARTLGLVLALENPPAPRRIQIDSVQ